MSVDVRQVKVGLWLSLAAVFVLAGVHSSGWPQVVVSVCAAFLLVASVVVEGRIFARYVRARRA